MCCRLTAVDILSLSTEQGLYFIKSQEQDGRNRSTQGLPSLSFVKIKTVVERNQKDTQRCRMLEAHRLWSETDCTLSYLSTVSPWASYLISVPRFLYQYSSVSCVWLCNPVVCSPPGSSVHGLLQARTMECVVMPSCRGSSQLRDWTQVSHIAGGFFTTWATRKSWCCLHLRYRYLHLDSS